MRITLGVLCTTVLAGTMGWASPCTSGSLSSYIALGSSGCTIGSVLFNDFASLPIPFGAGQISPGTVTVMPVATLYHPTLTFDIATSANAASGFLDLDIGFDASALPSNARIGGSQVTLNSPAFTADGSVTAIHDACPAGNFSGGVCSTTDYNAIVSDLSALTDLSEGTAFAATSPVAFMTDIGLDPGSTGTASLQSASVSVTAIPEPAQTGFLVGAAAALLLFFRGRKIFANFR